MARNSETNEEKYQEKKKQQRDRRGLEIDKIGTWYSVWEIFGIEEEITKNVGKIKDNKRVGKH